VLDADMVCVCVCVRTRAHTHSVQHKAAARSHCLPHVFSHVTATCCDTQVPRPDFFVKTLKIMANPGVALCLTPQARCVMHRHVLSG
jgi:hypothetical protein